MKNPLTDVAKSFITRYNEIAKKVNWMISYAKLAELMNEKVIFVRYHHTRLLKLNLLSRNIVTSRKLRFKQRKKRTAFGYKTKDCPVPVVVEVKAPKVHSEFTRVSKHSVKTELQGIALKLICGKLTPTHLMEIGQDLYEITKEL